MHKRTNGAGWTRPKPAGPDPWAIPIAHGSGPVGLGLARPGIAHGSGRAGLGLARPAPTKRLIHHPLHSICYVEILRRGPSKFQQTLGNHFIDCSGPF